MQALGGRASLAYTAEPDIKEWADGVALNPSRIPPEQPVDGDLAAVTERFSAAASPGIEALEELAGVRSRGSASD